jgi:hypothetical protein
MSSSLVAAWSRSVHQREVPVLFDQLTFKSLLQDHKEETPDKGIQDRSNDMTPILSLAVDALVHSPDADLADPNKIRLHITDFELRHLERRVTGDLFSSAKKKYSCNFDSLTLDSTCSNSFEGIDQPKPLAIFDQVFGHCSEHNSTTKAFDLCIESPLESPLSTTRDNQKEVSSQRPRRIKLAEFVDEDKISKNLSNMVELVKSQLEQRYNSVAYQNCQGNPLKAAKRKTEGRFSLF